MALLKKFGRRVRKVARKVRGKAIKRYFNKGYKPKMGQIVSDVALLKKMVNAEKKVTDLNMGFGNLALYGNATNTVDGAYCVDITPVCPQNLTRSGRIGNSIKLTSGCIDIRVDTDVGVVSNYKYVGYLIVRPDAQVALTASQIKDQMWELNPFTGVRDLNSNRDPEQFSGYRVLKRFTGSFPSDSLSGVDLFRHHKMPLKTKYHIRYNNDTSTKVEKNQMLLVIFASIGNTTTTNRLAVRGNVRWYFYDN